ncbi:unnamed protein product [Blepharisma stoltei]|uniref:Uncharacterized protein n=1 Tax=Blepharisma stoltei TaxID=1481888 RepID=A0AAU9J509_9CILI|nr:unnamed protein product [Blepharisma stoltei]
MIFKVKHPQLDLNPEEVNIGKKRFRHRKNTNSLNYAIIGEIPKSNNSFSIEENILRTKYQRSSNNSPPQGSPTNGTSLNLDYLISEKQNTQNFANRISSPKKLNDIQSPIYPRSQSISTDYESSSLSSYITHSPGLKHSNDDKLNLSIFKQPKFTKQNPLIIYNNPILGYTPRISREYSNSPDKRRSLADYGNMMISKR